MALTVKPVASEGELQVFLELPYRLYAANPCWVPPPPGTERWRLNPRKNPFFAHAAGCSFLAWRGREAVGRITAIVDSANPDQEAGTFGFSKWRKTGKGPPPSWPPPPTGSAPGGAGRCWVPLPFPVTKKQDY